MLNGNLINFRKRRQISSIILEFQRAQQKPYLFQRHEEVILLVSSCSLLLPRSLTLCSFCGRGTVSHLWKQINYTIFPFSASHGKVCCCLPYPITCEITLDSYEPGTKAATTSENFFSERPNEQSQGLSLSLFLFPTAITHAVLILF